MLTVLTGDEDDLRRHSHGTPSSRQHRRGVPDTPEPVGREYAQTLIFGSPSLRGTQNSLSRVVQGGLAARNLGQGAGAIGVTGQPKWVCPQAPPSPRRGRSTLRRRRAVPPRPSSRGTWRKPRRPAAPRLSAACATGARPRCRWRWASRRNSSCEWVEALARRRAAGTSPPRAAAARPRFGKARAQRRLLPRALLGRLQLT